MAFLYLYRRMHLFSLFHLCIISPFLVVVYHGFDFFSSTYSFIYVSHAIMISSSLCTYRYLNAIAVGSEISAMPSWRRISHESSVLGPTNILVGHAARSPVLHASPLLGHDLQSNTQKLPAFPNKPQGTFEFEALNATLPFRH